MNKLKSFMAGGLILPLVSIAKGQEGVDISEPGSIERILTYASNWAFGIFFVIAAACVLYAALLFLTSGGNEKKIPVAKTTLIYALLAIVIALIARSVPGFLEGALQEGVSGQ